jgi:hypothetical protein
VAALVVLAVVALAMRARPLVLAATAVAMAQVERGVEVALMAAVVAAVVEVMLQLRVLMQT